MIAATQRLMDEGEEYIYEATFNYEGILVMVDVLHVKSNEVSIYEVKSSTGVKDIYLYMLDVAKEKFQINIEDAIDVLCGK